MSLYRFWFLVVIALPSDCGTHVQHVLGSGGVVHMFTGEATEARNSSLSQSQLGNPVEQKRTLSAGCPPDYHHVDKYCIKITRSYFWKKAFQQCYEYGIEKTPLDAVQVWSNSTLLTTIWGMLPVNISSIWLPAEQKLGTILYSAPTPSDFSYSTNDLTWCHSKSKSQNNCLTLDFKKKELSPVSCLIQLPFVCLFPSIFWTKRVTFNNYFVYKAIYNEYRWQRSQNKSTEQLNNVTNWTRITNICMYTNSIQPNGYLSALVKLWYPNFENLTSTLVYNASNICSSCNKNYTYYCLKSVPNAVHVKNNRCFPVMYKTQLENVEIINTIYGIHCYSYDKQQRADKTDVSVCYLSSLFYEVLASKTEVRHNSETSVVLQVYDTNENLNVYWMNSRFDTSFCVELSTDKQNQFVDKIHAHRTSAQNNVSISVLFCIHISINDSAAKEKLLRNYTLQHQRLFSMQKILSLAIPIMIKITNNTEYCLDNCSNINYMSCITQMIKWPKTLSPQSVICTGKLVKRAHTKYELLEACWEMEAMEIKYPESFAERTMYVLGHENKENLNLSEFNNLFGDKRNVKQEQEAYVYPTFTYFQTALSFFKGFEFTSTGNGTRIVILGDNTNNTNIHNSDVKVLFKNIPVNDDHITVGVFKDVLLYSNNFSLASPVVHIDMNVTLNTTLNISAYFKISDAPSEDFACGHWNLRSHQWTTEDSIYMGNDKIYHHCIFHNPSSFALLTKLRKVPLGVIYLTGRILSVLGIVLLMLAHILFTERREGGHDRELFVNLTLSLMCMYLTFIFGFRRTYSETVCIVSGSLLHYFTLTSFFWVMVVAYDAYLNYVVVLGSYIPNFILKVSIAAWVAPCIPVLIVASTDYTLFRGDHFCHIHSYKFYYVFLLPLVIVVTITISIFLSIFMNTCCRHSQIRVHQKKNRRHWLEMKILFVIFVLVVLMWIFGFLIATDCSNLSYMFCFTVPLQGLFMIFIYAVLNKGRLKDKLRISHDLEPFCTKL